MKHIPFSSRVVLEQSDYKYKVTWKKVSGTAPFSGPFYDKNFVEVHDSLGNLTESWVCETDWGARNKFRKGVKRYLG